MRRGLVAPLAALVTGTAVLPIFAVSARRLAGAGAGLPLDDAWIHIRFAMNLAAGHGFAFNPGEAVAGSTSPLWVMVLAALRLLGGEPAAVSAAASAVAFLVTCVLAALLGERLAARTLAGDGCGPVPAALAGAAAGALTALTGRFAWSGLSGMEVGLFAALTLAAAHLLLGEERGSEPARSWPLAAGLALLARPEGGLFLPAALGVEAARRARLAGNWRRAWPLRAAALALAPALPWMVFCLWSGGSLLPSTFTPNRGGLGWPDGPFLLATLRLLGSDNPMAAPLAVLGMIAVGEAVLRRQRDPRLLLPVLWVAVFPLAAAVVAPNLRHHGRYNMPLIPMLAVLAAVGAVAAGRRLAPCIGVRWTAARGGDGRRAAAWRAAVPLGLATLLLAAGLLGAAGGLDRWSRAFARDVQNIRSQHERVGRWLASTAGPGCRVATHDIGAIGVLSGCHVTDLIGLVTPQVARLFLQEPDPARRDPRIRHLLEAARVTHVAVYPGWFPALARDRALRPVFEARVDVRSSSGAARMVVYRTPAPGPW